MASKYDYDLGVIGAGSAGLTLASGAAQLGARVVLIEKEPVLGGDCLHYGCVPSKTLIKTAKVYHQMKKAGEYGLPPVEAGPVDFARVRDHIKGVIANIQPHDSVERFCGLGVQVEFGRARFVDEHTVDTGDRRLSAAKWLIATGSEPGAPPIPGLAETPHITNKELFYLDSLPASLVVLGGGPIAVEMAQAMARLGSQVTIIQRSGQILSKEDKDLADLVQARLEAEGVRVILGAATKSVADKGSHREVTIAVEGREEVVSGETLLVALGRTPQVADLGLEEIGVEFSPKGLVVDDRLRTSQKHIFGAGDATGRHLFTHAAGYEGGVVLANAMLRLPRKADYTWLPWCTYSDPELASVGMNEKAAQEAGIEYKVWREEFWDNDRAQAEAATLGGIKMIVDHREHVIGVQICGLHAGEILSEWVAVLNGGVKLSSLAGAIHPYPTLGEINKRVAGDLLAPKLFSDTVKKGLKFFFHLRGRACRMEGGQPRPLAE